MLKRLSKCSIRFVFVIISFFSVDLHAQVSENTPLLSLFSTLEEKFDIKFSYVPDEVKDVFVIAPNPNGTLAETLTYLNENTSLNFSQINYRYITAVSKQNGLALCGKVLNAVTNLPLEGATIKSARNFALAITNSAGVFSIPKNVDTETIALSYVGFESRRLSISKLNASCGPIFLEPTTLNLNQVVLETLFTKGISKQRDGSFLINTPNFGLLPGQVDGDVLNIAQALPGVESVDETISTINIRGGTHDENSILWDDIKMYQSGHFFGLISAFNPDITKKVKVYKNGTNPRYGEGVSGVIDIRSENSISKSFSSGIGFNLLNASAFAEIPVSKSFGIQISGRRSISDFVKSPVYGIYADRIFQDTEITAIKSDGTGASVSSENEFKFYDFSTKILWDASKKTRFRLNFLTIDNALEFTETLDTTNDSETSDLEQRSLVGGLSWKQLWSKKVNTEILAYGSYYVLNSLNEEIFTTQKLFQENEILETGIKFDANLRLSEKVEIQTGYHFSETGIANTQDVNLPVFQSFEKNILQTHSVFGNFRYTSNGGGTNINAGLRNNYFLEYDEAVLEPRLSVHQKLGNGFALEALGEFKSQTTTQRIDFESDFLGVEKRRWVLSDNNEVPIIKSKQASLGIVYNKYNWFINVEGFYKLVEGITASNQGFQNQFQFTRTDGKYIAKGVEVVLNKQIKDFSAWFTYTYSKNDYTFDDLIPSEFSSNFDVRHTATLASAYTHNNLKLALGINWHSGKPYTSPVSGEEILSQNGFQFIQYDKPNNERLPDYFRTNISVEYLWGVSNKIDAKFNLAVLNIFDTKNTLNIRYGLDNDENGDARVNRVEERSLGLTPNFSLQVLF